MENVEKVNDVMGTIAIDFDMTKNFKEILDSNSGEAYMQLFMQYIIGFVELFQEYCKRDDIDQRISLVFPYSLFI